MAQVSRLVRSLALFTLVVALLSACDLIGGPPEGGNNGDTEAPTVTLKSSTSSVTTADPITLTATAKDNVGVSKVEFFMDGNTTAFSTDDDGSDGFAATKIFTGADNGTHTFTAKAFDAAGNSASSNEVTVEVAIDTSGDSEAPTAVVLSGPTDITTTDPVTFTATAEDNVGVVKVEFVLDSEATPFASDEDSADGFSAQTSFAATDNGDHTITAKAFDAAGNSTTSDALVVTVTITDGGTPAGPMDDMYSTFGNTELIVDPDAPTDATTDKAAYRRQASVLVNDGDGATVTSLDPITTAQGGTVMMTADGGFTYLPPVGVTDVTDSFTYTNSNGDSPTVTINLSELIWYVDNSLTENGNGSSSSPFNILADLDEWAIPPAGEAPNDAEDAAHFSGHSGDYIFVFEGDGTDTNQNGGYVLLANQKLIGQGVDLVVDGQTLVKASGNPVISDGLDRQVGSTGANTVTSGYGVVIDSRVIEAVTDPSPPADPEIVPNTLGIVIKGLTIENTAHSGIMAPGEYGTNGSITIENVTLVNNGGPEFSGTDADNNQQAESAIDVAYAADPGMDRSADVLTIRNVTIKTPKRFGIYVTDAAKVEVANAAVTGLQDATLLTRGTGFGGEGIALYTTLGGSYSIHDSSVQADVGVFHLDGVHIWNQGAGGAATLSADLTANTITLDDTFNDTTKEGAETVGFRLTNDSAGTFSVAGTGNAVTAVSKLVKNGTGPFEGQVEIGGTMMPMGRLQAVPMPTYKNYDARD